MSIKREDIPMIRTENLKTAPYIYTIFCKCSWSKNVIPEGMEAGLAVKTMKQETKQGCQECGSKKLFIKNIK